MESRKEEKATKSVGADLRSTKSALAERQARYPPENPLALTNGAEKRPSTASRHSVSTEGQVRSSAVLALREINDDCVREQAGGPTWNPPNVHTRRVSTWCGRHGDERGTEYLI